MDKVANKGCRGQCLRAGEFKVSPEEGRGAGFAKSVRAGDMGQSARGKGKGVGEGSGARKEAGPLEFKEGGVGAVSLQGRLVFS